MCAPADSDKQGWVSGMASGKLHPSLKWNKSGARRAEALQHKKTLSNRSTFDLPQVAAVYVDNCR